jgi:hypothetical protein
MNNNPLHHVGQSARPEGETALPDEQAGDAGGEARQVNPSEGPGQTLEQHPRTTPNGPAGPAPGAKNKTLEDLEPGEPPPESSAGS